MLTLSGAPSTTSHFGYTSFHLDYNILYNLHCLGSPLGYCTLIFDLTRNLYIYNACIYIYSILLTGMDGAAGRQILSPRLFITQ